MRRSFVITVCHGDEAIMYTVHSIGRNMARLEASIKYPNASTIHVLEA